MKICYINTPWTNSWSKGPHVAGANKFHVAGLENVHLDNAFSMSSVNAFLSYEVEWRNFGRGDVLRFTDIPWPFSRNFLKARELRQTVNNFPTRREVFTNFMLHPKRMELYGCGEEELLRLEEMIWSAN